MKCFADEALWEFLEGASSEKDAVLKHIQHCGNCRQRLEELKAEQAELRLAAGQVQLLDESFVGEVMERIAELDEKERTAEVNRKRPKGHSRWKWFGAAAAGLAVAVTVGALASPTFASYLPLFRQFVQVQEQDMNKLYRRDGIKVTDQGLTVHVKHIVADSTQLMVFYQIEDSRGKVLPIYRHWIRHPYLVLDDGSGQPQLGMIHTGGYPGRDVDKATWAALVFDLNKVKRKDRLTLKLDTKQVGSVKGSWKLNVPIDLSKLTGTVHEAVIGKTLEAHGIRVRLKKIKFAPLGTFLELEPSISPELKKEYVRVLGKEHKTTYGFGFCILDEYGNVVAEMPADPMDRRRQGIQGTEKLNTYLMQPIPHNRRFTFELTEVKRLEPVQSILELNLGKLPATTGDRRGNVVTITSTEFKSISELNPYDPSDDRVLVLKLKGRMKKTGDQKFYLSDVTDETGSPLQIRYGSISSNREGEMTGELAVSGLSRIPHRLFLKLSVVRKYSGLSVKADLPINP